VSDPILRQLFAALDRDGRGRVRGADLLTLLRAAGFTPSDARLESTFAALTDRGDAPIDLDTFAAIVRPNILLVERILQGHTVIPDFADFSAEIGRLFAETRRVTAGKVADYIPQLGRVEPEQYAVAVCTVDGQRFGVGDTRVGFSVQSCSKPIVYCLALEQHGDDLVHRHVGREPSGRGFNDLTLDHQGRPHNPMINAGSIMCCALVKPDLALADRFDFVQRAWSDLAGGAPAGFNNSVYLSERATADRNFALGYFMREHKVFPPGTDLQETLEFYFQSCSVELDAERMSVVAATLANGGVCPTTGRQIFGPRTVRNCLSLMYSCGMYDFSGEFAFTIGLPAKSGISGALLLVVPNVLGLCVWSPRIDRHGNSARGVEFCKGLVARFNFHNYDDLTGLSNKKDPRHGLRARSDEVTALIWAASQGDLGAVQQLLARGARVDAPDYDGRTPLHLAAAEGHAHIVEYLLAHGADPAVRDRWQRTPGDDARRGDHADVEGLLIARDPA
jgi:glutaminase